MKVDRATQRSAQWLAQWIPLTLAGHGVKIDDPLRDVKVAQNDLSLVNIAEPKGAGKVRIITVRANTPFAQQRFDEEAKIAYVTCLSDYRGGEFGNTHGLLLEGPHMLTRALMVVDNMNTICSLQITPELTQLPDMEEAFRSARRLVTERSGETGYGNNSWCARASISHCFLNLNLSSVLWSIHGAL